MMRAVILFLLLTLFLNSCNEEANEPEIPRMENYAFDDVMAIREFTDMRFVSYDWIDNRWESSSSSFVLAPLSDTSGVAFLSNSYFLSKSLQKTTADTAHFYYSTSDNSNFSFTIGGETVNYTMGVLRYVRERFPDHYFAYIDSAFGSHHLYSCYTIIREYRTDSALYANFPSARGIVSVPESRRFTGKSLLGDYQGPIEVKGLFCPVFRFAKDGSVMVGENGRISSSESRKGTYSLKEGAPDSLFISLNDGEKMAFAVAFDVNGVFLYEGDDRYWCYSSSN